MKRISILISVLLLLGVVGFVGFAGASEVGQSVNADFSAQNLGRCRTTDSSVIIKVWNTGGLTTTPGVGVSASGVITLYTDVVTPVGFQINTRSSSYDTVGEVVDYINTNFATDSSINFHASIGDDAYSSMAVKPLLADIEAPGLKKSTAVKIKTANSRLLSAGVEAEDGVTPRIKSISCQLAAGSSTGVQLNVYDDGTNVWQKYTATGVLSSSTADSASPNVVTFPNGKGISGTKGKGLCVVATTDANVDSDTIAKSVDNVSIIYDKLRD